MNYLGLDWGKNKIGVAIGSDETRTAVPFEIIRFSEMDEVFSRLAKMVLENDIDGFIVGVPTNKILAKDLAEFIERLKTEFSLPISTIDEKTTTKLAEGLLGASKKDEDSVAAMIILQNFMDRKDYERRNKN